MRHVDPHILRVIQSLSQTIGKRLEIAEGESDGLFVVSSPNAHPHYRFAIRSSVPLSPGESDLVRGMIELIQNEIRTHSEYQALDQRVRILERENVDLMMKNRALAEVSSRDSLTGLYTRWFIMDKIDAEMSRAMRHGSAMAVLMLDIDHFKKVNDTYGHAAGDHVLREVGHVLRDSCRVYDMPGRYGGEEFCLMLPETKVEGTLNVAERIRRRLEERVFDLDGDTVQVTASIGVAGVDGELSEPLFNSASLIERADRALYTAKDRGRNRVEVWNETLLLRAHPQEH